MPLPTHIREKRQGNPAYANIWRKLALLLLSLAAVGTWQGCHGSRAARPLKTLPGAPEAKPESLTTRALYLEVLGNAKRPTMVLVNGVPQGEAPRTLLIPVTPQGFSREVLLISVRVLATQAGEETQTFSFTFERQDRIPAKLSLANGKWEVSAAVN